jgi:hypothetical protein
MGIQARAFLFTSLPASQCDGRMNGKICRFLAVRQLGVIQHSKFASGNTARISRHRGTLLEFAWMQEGPMGNATIGPA